MVSVRRRWDGTGLKNGLHYVHPLLAHTLPATHSLSRCSAEFIFLRRHGPPPSSVNELVLFVTSGTPVPRPMVARFAAQHAPPLRDCRLA